VKVTVRYIDPLRKITQTKMEELEVPKGTTVEDLMRILSKKHGRNFVEYLYDEKGELRRKIRFIVNGGLTPTFGDFTRRAKLAQAKTKMRENDDLTIMPVVGGG
jgi:MoaD family protein